ncbi:hypothetical protein A1O3_09679 [Capronia epimyces CBS 606.96]|uniref:Uncharacterized protein n=1 Tax=Capronia epimyces CBS 606.96 TaxID=1182542 RepID=W9XB72_9EURO|nr:uncharacterized protein A1O3_09679 [Capronia epimyces CBS 606.96]EXJ77453.1 hypothetical protein A1O3_09679 [Capronia epimyces CBS 606.96]
MSTVNQEFAYQPQSSTVDESSVPKPGVSYGQDNNYQINDDYTSSHDLHPYIDPNDDEVELDENGVLVDQQELEIDDGFLDDIGMDSISINDAVPVGEIHPKVRKYLERWDDRIHTPVPQWRHEDCISRYRARLRHIVATLCSSAKSIADPDTLRATSSTRPMTFNWWAFLSRISVDDATDVLINHTPVTTQIILGNVDLKPEHLKFLPFDWRYLLLHGTYIDLIEDGSEFFTYSGSTRGQKGFHGRCSYYRNIIKKGIPNHRLEDHGRHEARLAKAGISSCVRIISIYHPDEHLDPYVLFQQLIGTIYVNAFCTANPNSFATEAALRIVHQARPSFHATFEPKGLNSAVQMLQGLSLRSKHEICANPDCQATTTKQ